MNLQSVYPTSVSPAERILFYRPDIDGLRALAVLLVIAFHFFGVRGGFIGVDIFFVISGYLITSILLRELDAGRYTLSGFYARRIKRIFPALLLVLGTCLIFGWFALLAHEYKLLGKHVLAGTTFSSNIVLWLEAGYFDKASHLKPLLHLWSLGVEEQFYIFWPLLLALFYKKSWSIKRLLVILITTSFFLNLYVSSFSAVTAFYNLPTRSWQLLVGAVLAYFQWSKISISGSQVCTYKEHIFSLLGLSLVSWSASQLSAVYIYPSYWAAVPTSGAVLLIAAGPKAWVNKNLFSNRWMVNIGLISYPLYLWHWPLISFARIMGNGEVDRNIKIACFLVSLILAFITYAVIEKAVRHRKGFRITSWLLSSLILLGGAGLFVVARDGLSYRHPDKERVYQSLLAVDSRYAFNQLDFSCNRPFLAEKYLGVCQQSKANALPNTLLIGDSHAISSYPGLAFQSQLVGQSLMMIARGACVPLIGVETHRDGELDVCKNIMSEIYEYALSQPSIKNIIITFRAPWYLYGGGKTYDKKELNPIILRGLSFEEGLIGTYRALRSMGKQVFLYIDVPELDFLPEDCLDLRPLSLVNKKLNPDCSMSSRKALSISNDFRMRLTAIKRELPDLIIFDTFDYFCKEGRCFASQDEIMMYEDGNHLSTNGSMYLGEKFFLKNRGLLGFREK